MSLEESIPEHALVHHRVTEYAKKPDGSLKADDVGADDACGLGHWLATDEALRRGRMRLCSEHTSDFTRRAPRPCDTRMLGRYRTAGWVRGGAQDGAQ